MIPASVSPRDLVPTPLALDPRVDPVVARYRRLFALLDWTVVPERDARRAWPGRPPHPRTAYIKALLVKLVERTPFITELRAFLVEHPALVRELGFHLTPDPTHPAGFDVERTVPGARWLRHQQQTLDLAVLRTLLAQTVRLLQTQLPDLGTTVAIDVKHLYAWVRENNPRESIPHRFDPTRQPAGDPDCRLGAKARTNQTGARPGAGGKEFLWGYATGIATTLAPQAGDVVLAELTHPFNHQDITVFHPLHAQCTAHLGHPPQNLAADAAFDAWSVYQACADTGGIAAIAHNRRGPTPPRDAAGHPLCAAGRSMAPAGVGWHEDGYRVQRYRCPLRWPVPTGEPCADARFARGGCTKRVNIEPGGRLRADLDRTSAAYRAIYRQRTSAERINSQAKDRGIERPMVRRLAGVARLNTLTYLLLNLKALQRLHARQAALAPPSVTALC